MFLPHRNLPGLYHGKNGRVRFNKSVLWEWTKGPMMMFHYRRARDHIQQEISAKRSPFYPGKHAK